MNKNLLMQYIFDGFKIDVKNSVVLKNNIILVKLSNGMKIKIKTKYVD